MASIDNIHEILDQIQQQLNSAGGAHISTQLDDLEIQVNGNTEWADQILNLRIQQLISESDFDQLATLVDQRESDHPPLAIRLLLAKGILSNIEKDFKQSLRYFLEAEKKAETAEYLNLQAQIQINIGTVYAGLHYYEKGVRRYDGALNHYKDYLNDRSKAALFHNQGNLQYALGDLDRSIKSFNESMALSDAIKDEPLKNKSALLLARSILKANRKSKPIIPVIDPKDSLYTIHQLCLACSGERTSDSYEEHLLTVIALSNPKTDFQTRMDALHLLVVYYKDQGDYKRAFETQQQYAKVESELKSLQEASRLTEQEVVFEIAQKEEAIINLEKEKVLQNEIVIRNEMLEVANEDLRQFAYVVSHDLKEPLRMIGSYTQLIELGFIDQTDNDQKEYFKYINGGVDRLNLLLDGLSNYATLKSLQEEHSTVLLTEVVQLAMENLSVLIQDEAAEIKIDGDAKIEGSPVLLTLLFQNLIQNAIKFKSPQIQPVITISTLLKDDNLVIDVKDNGIGIPADQAERVFIIFQRLHRNEQLKGTGMGLAICKKIIQLHDGKIGIYGDADGATGTTVRIELPN